MGLRDHPGLPVHPERRDPSVHLGRQALRAHPVLLAPLAPPDLLAPPGLPARQALRAHLVRLAPLAPPDLLARPADSQVPAAVSGTSAAGLNAGQSYSLTNTCPAGKKILGGGYTYTVSTANQTSRVAVDSYPSAGNAWTATVRVHQNLGGGVTVALSVYAVCTV